MNWRFVSEQLEPKFEDCRECQNFNRSRESALCRKCEMGEYFKERISDETPDDEELMRIYARMIRDDNQ
jgi:hypothetical protein